MAMGDFTYFTPAESLYTKPGAADERARQEAIKKANYLASMDQFYANLAETIREYDKTYGLQERAATLAEKEQAEASTYRTTALAQTKELAEKGYALEEMGLRQQYQLGLLTAGTEAYKADLAYKAATTQKSPTVSGGMLVPPEAQFEHTSDRLAREEQALREQVLRGY